jgi:hypothetical protein
MSAICFLAILWNSQKPQIIGHEGQYHHIIDRMPLVDDGLFAHLADGSTPIEQRGIEYRKWLATGLKISVRNGSGSGTIIYYDHKTGWAWVQSCGHLWSGNMSAADGKNRNVTCTVTTWYHNMTKLDSPRSYTAEVLYYSNQRGKDISLLRFKPDWEPDFFPIAPADYKLEKNVRLHSVGCDGGREVAHYDVRYIGERTYDIVTTENSPRPGRSGGGLMSNDGYFVGVCWGTSDYSGSGNGYFTSLKVIREFNEKNGFGWLNDSGHLPRQIPIIDRNNPQGDYPRNYIPLPGNRF